MTEMTMQRWLDTAWISPDVAALRPDYAALLLVADGLRPGPSDNDTEGILSAAEDTARAHLARTPIAELPHVGEWRETFKLFGAKPQRARPSVEALLRRLDPGLPRIDRITDVYNAVSISHLLPIGGEDLGCYRGALRLVRATGQESFDTSIAGQPAIEHPAEGEVVWRDDAGVTCRRWNWRQCHRTRITGTTTSGLFILDGLSALGADGLRRAGDHLVDLLLRTNPGARTAVGSPSSEAL